MPAGVPTPSRLNDLFTDVLIAAPADGQVIQYETASGKWKNVTAAGGASSPLSLTAHNAAEVPLTIQSAVSQTANLLEVKDSGGTVRTKIKPGNIFSITPNQSITDESFEIIWNGAQRIQISQDTLFIKTGYINFTGSFGFAGVVSNIMTVKSYRGIEIIPGGFAGGDGVGSLVVRAGNDVTVPIFCVKAGASQSGNLIEVQASDGTILSGFSENGYPFNRKNSVPADSELAAGELMLWFDSTNGASKLMIKAKQADGTVKTANVPLA